VTGVKGGVDDVVRHPRARGWRLKVDPVSGRTRLTVPARGALRPALAWAAGQGAWIAAARAGLPTPRPFSDGAAIPFGDGMLTIAWIAGASRRVERDGERLSVGGPVEGVARRVETWLRGQALAVLTADTRHYADLAGVTVDAVAIGDPRGRWGSCSSDGAVRFSWRLVCAPVAVRRHVAAHEVAHRVHMNHGAAFHMLVERLYGTDPAPARAWLREHGAGLHWLGRAA
jgi:hypothetical protein